MKVEKVMINGKGYYHYRKCLRIPDLCKRCCFMTVNDVGKADCMLPFKCEPDGYYIRYNEKPIEIGGAKIYVDVPPPPEPGEADKEQEGKAAAQQQLTERSEVKKESYVVINGVRYDAVKREKIGETCKQCVFNGERGCTKPNAGGFQVLCNGRTSFVSKGEVAGEVAAQQRLTERNEEETEEVRKDPGKADKVKREGSIGKRSYYGFPNGVEAEDICRYLSFNLGNVVKYACRAGRKDATKKIEDLQKARDYLDNEIKRLEEGDE